MSEFKTQSIRFSAEMHEKLKELAAQNHRSVNVEVNLLLEQALNQPQPDCTGCRAQIHRIKPSWFTRVRAWLIGGSLCIA
jgi:hypothetical protein